MNSRATFHALYRFGLGPKPGEVQHIGNDPRGWLLAQAQHNPLPPELQALVAKPVQHAHLADRSDDDKRKLGQFLQDSKQRYIRDCGLRFQAQQISSQPLQERLVLFWSNHFSVSVQKPILAGLVNRYEIEAIRPHLNQHFEDMLLAVVQHPAMLLYLDNVQSLGPDSRAGKRRDKGLNENLAREILELHSLGVNGGYSQQDVIALAKIITGWSLQRSDGGPQLRYAFRPELHQPGSKTLLGRRIAEGGEDEGVQALRMLARHPATARHISVKLAQHFVADQPPEALVERLTKIYLHTNGHLPSLIEALIDAPEAWAQPLAKLKSPYEFALSALRLSALTVSPEHVMQGLDALNARPFNASSPAGFADTMDTWNSPGALLKRVTWASRLGQRLPTVSEPVSYAEQSLGALLSDSSRLAISRAETSQQALGLLLASPEFQRR
jgi:uncharacterized protein (DUF1800 family)